MRIRVFNPGPTGCCGCNCCGGGGGDETPGGELDVLLQETGDALLLEDGGFILLEVQS